MAEGQPTPGPVAPGDYVRRVVVTLGLAALAVMLFVWTWYAIQVLLIAFAGVLLAILLRELANFISRNTPLSNGWSRAVVILAVIGVLVGLGWLTLPRIARQADELAEKLPEQMEKLEA